MRYLGEVSELRCPDGVGPEAHEMVRHPHRPVTATVEVGQPRKIERKGCPQEPRELDGHAGLRGAEVENITLACENAFLNPETSGDRRRGGQPRGDPASS